MIIRKLQQKETAPMALLLDADPSEKMVKEYLQRGECFVAENGQEVVGVYVLLPTRPGTAELVNIAVKEAWQGNGLGKQLVKDAVQRANVAGFQTLEIGTGNSSIGQLALYQKCGFRVVGVDAGFFIRHYPEEIYENGLQCQDMIRLAQDLD